MSPPPTGRQYSALPNAREGQTFRLSADGPACDAQAGSTPEATNSAMLDAEHVTPAVLSVRGLRKTYGSGSMGTAAIDDISFEVQRGEFLCVVGPSGCGKTTLLKCVAGLLKPSAGTVLFENRAYDRPPDGLAVVFQDYSRSLFPWFSARRNVALPLATRGFSRTRRNELAHEALAAVGLTQVADRHPGELSGGMQQRVAIARALAYQPDLLLMDEPFASVDAQTRIDLEDLVLQVWNEFRISALLVTHDIDEAVYLADRVVVLSGAPSHVRTVIDIDLPRPRDQVATKRDATFINLRADILRLIRRPSVAPSSM